MRAEQILRSEIMIRLAGGSKRSAWKTLSFGGTENMDRMLAALWFAEGEPRHLIHRLHRPTHELAGYIHFKALADALALRHHMHPSILRWWQEWLWLAERCRLPNGDVVIPGCRVEWQEDRERNGELEVRGSPQTTAVYHAFRGQPIPERVKVHGFHAGNAWFAGAVEAQKLGLALQPVRPAGALFRPAYDLVGFSSGSVAFLGDLTCQDGPLPAVVDGVPVGVPKFVDHPDMPKGASERNWRLFAQANMKVSKHQRLDVRLNGVYRRGGKHAPPEREIHERWLFDVGSEVWSFRDGILVLNSEQAPPLRQPRDGPKRWKLHHRAAVDPEPGDSPLEIYRSFYVRDQNAVIVSVKGGGPTWWRVASAATVTAGSEKEAVDAVYKPTVREFGKLAVEPA